MKNINKKQLTIFIVMIILVAAVSVGLTLTIVKSSSGDNLNSKQAKQQTSEFINNNLMTGDTSADIKEVKEEYGLYKMKVDVGGEQNIESYLTKDGKLLFPQAIDLKEAQNQETAQESGSNNQDIPKQEKPKVEFFTMSHCPYGTQTSKGFLPVVKTLGDKIDFKVKFVNYAMHGEKELQEQLNQYCIQENYQDKYLGYLECFLEEEGDNSASCMEEFDINKEEIAACADKQDKKYSVMENFKNDKEYKGRYPSFKLHQEENEKYDIKGSPSLAINDTKISSFSRSPQALLDLVCKGFEDKPQECEEDLSSDNPSPGFGFSESKQTASAAGACQ